jgi:hypothetical protein
MHLEQVRDGIQFEYRKGYHLDQSRNNAIPHQFRRADGFYHWHMHGCIPGYFLLANSLETKVRALFWLLFHFPTPCASFGLTKEIFEALAGQSFDQYKETFQ